MENTSLILGSRFEKFIASEIKSERYKTASEVVRDGLRLLEQRGKIEKLREAILEGEASGDAGILDMEAIRQEALSELHLENKNENPLNAKGEKRPESNLQI